MVGDDYCKFKDCHILFGATATKISGHRWILAANSENLKTRGWRYGLQVVQNRSTDSPQLQQLGANMCSPTTVTISRNRRCRIARRVPIEVCKMQNTDVHINLLRIFAWTNATYSSKACTNLVRQNNDGIPRLKTLPQFQAHRTHKGAYITTRSWALRANYAKQATLPLLYIVFQYVI